MTVADEHSRPGVGWVPFVMTAPLLVPRERNYARELVELEKDKLWPKVWQWACREEHLLHVGDYVTYDVGPHSIILVSSSADEIKGYVNACLHRGTQFRPSDTVGGVSPVFRGFYSAARPSRAPT